MSFTMVRRAWLVVNTRALLGGAYGFTCSANTPCAGVLVAASNHGEVRR